MTEHQNLEFQEYFWKIQVSLAIFAPIWARASLQLFMTKFVDIWSFCRWKALNRRQIYLLSRIYLEFPKKKIEKSVKNTDFRVKNDPKISCFHGNMTSFQPTVGQVPAMNIFENPENRPKMTENHVF